MNKQLLILSVLFSLSSLQGFVCSESALQVKTSKTIKKASLRRLCTAYIASIALSGCIGAATGSIVRYLEKKFELESTPMGLFFVIFGWMLESEFRNDVIAVLQQDLDVYQIEHKKGLMFKCAWVASWLAYLQGQNSRFTFEVKRATA